MTPEQLDDTTEKQVIIRLETPEGQTLATFDTFKVHHYEPLVRLLEDIEDALWEAMFRESPRISPNKFIKDGWQTAPTLAAEVARLKAENEAMREALVKIRDKAKSWEGRKEAPYWNLGDIAAGTLKRLRAALGGE